MAHVGFLMVTRPLAAAAGLTLMLAALFMVCGVFRIVAALSHRFHGWGWVLLNGVVSLVLGVLIWQEWPEASFWVIGLARDLQRYLADEPVEAGPPSAGYRLRKLVRRHRGPALAAAGVLLALVAGVAGTTWGLVRAERARQAEAEQRRRTRQALDDMLSRRPGASAWLGANSTISRMSSFFTVCLLPRVRRTSPR
jgi:hypothetical protein